MNNPNFESIKRLASRHQALLFLISLAVLGRLLPHPDNITPLAAIGLFAGAYLDRRLFLLVPVIAAFVSDLAGPGFYNLLVMLFVYAGLMLSASSGRLLLKGQRKFPRLPAAVLVSAIGFYLVSNLGAWWAFYDHSLEGLLSCYVNGLPYLGRTLAGDAFYSLIFFGLYESMLTGQKRLAAHV
jgi:hypothetical protein